MSIFKTSALALAILASVAAVPAQAAPIASAVSVVTFENFQISWVATDAGRQVNAATDFASLSITSSQQTSANMPGGLNDGNLVSSSVGADLMSRSVLGVVDPVINSAGGITASQVFNVPSLPLVGNFATSVSNETGAPVLNFPSTPGVTANADLHNASYASLDTLNGTAGATTSSSLGSTVKFQNLVDGDSLKFTFDVGQYIGAFLSAGANQSAFASWGISIILQDDVTGLTVAEFDAGNSRSNNAPGSGTTLLGAFNTGLTGGFANLLPGSFVSDALVAGQFYTLSANITTTTTVERQAVPEPGALALVGLALAALGISRRSQKRA